MVPGEVSESSPRIIRGTLGEVDPLNFLQSREMSCDPWHYTGSSEFHYNGEGQAFIEKCKASLPRLAVTVSVNHLGYPSKVESIEGVGWTLDEVGRFFMAEKDRLIFQRYLNGDILMERTKPIGCWKELLV